MLINKNKTYFKSSITNQNQWYLINAANQNLGRFSSKIAYMLRGKNSTEYAPHIKNNIYIIIINSKLIKVTGNKRKQKTYKRHSGKPGGLKTETFDNLQKRLPNKILEKSIKGMLPKNSLGRQIFTQIKIYADNKHPHSAQQPKLLQINAI
uniref:Large ribosomal subunit protein uL13c n=1 Tax=Caloglossa beccarii TaxID=131038 RepID=A0A1Z1M935_9FLOR|nr:ribosomal protein L13 [Caloglossa beccarii]ARW62341.1 ribosomal protein L13 [Caloglossa beccarii]